MIDFDRATFDRLLPATPGLADWEDVMTRCRVHKRRRRVAVLAAVAFVAVIGAASALGVRALVLELGTTALPPVGATPSTPETGEIAIHYYGRPGVGHPPVHQVWVYSDGRLIWRNEAGPFGVVDAAGEVRTGLLEQRLTPKGVELLRSELIASGLFDRDHALLDSREWFWGTMQVHNGDRLVSVEWAGPPVIPPDYFQGREAVATPEQASALLRLSELLADPAQWMPASAWEDQELRAYVPSKYAVCYWEPSDPTWAGGRYLEPSRVVSALPEAAKDLVRGKDRAYEIWNGAGTDLDLEECSEVTTDEARALAEIFTHAGFERDPLPGGVPQGTWDNSRFWAPAPIAVRILFEPILPHGEWEQMGG